MSVLAIMIGGRAVAQENTEYWKKIGEDALKQRVNTSHNTQKAKNIILFIGDGMGISTLTAGRIYDGQKKGLSGEGNRLSFETFPFSALVATYNTNAQISASASTATAMNTGVKTRSGVINTAPRHPRNQCAGSKEARLETFAEFAEQQGMSTGVVSSARLSHATPAAVYAYSASRDWENDTALPEDANPLDCPDIASQITGNLGGNGLEVALGGGWVNFLPTDQGGKRQDNRDITKEWMQAGGDRLYLNSKDELSALSPKTNARILGLFSPSHLPYNLDRKEQDVSLTDLTEFAVQNLEARGTGYYLMVEGGRIDHAHHGGNAKRALDDTSEFSKAIARTLELVNPDETLILVTADHSHVFTIAGYAKRGNPILGLSIPPSESTADHERENHQEIEPILARDNKPYTTLGYQNGPGAIQGNRSNLANTDTQADNFRQQAAVPTQSETHGGEDVALYAKGPWSHLARGLMEQNVIYYIMRHAIQPN